MVLLFKATYSRYSRATYRLYDTATKQWTRCSCRGKTLQRGFRWVASGMPNRDQWALAGPKRILLPEGL